MIRFLPLLLLPFAASAQELRECPLVPVENVLEHRVFANGAIYFEVVLVDGPACCEVALVVRHPAPEGKPTCHGLYRDGYLGWADMTLETAEAAYDPARGLTVSVPAQIYLPEESFQNPTLLHVTINQATGAVTVEQELGPE